MTSNQKSYCYRKSPDPIVDYCNKLTIRMDALQEELQEYTLNNVESPLKLTTSEMLTIGANFIKLIEGKRCLDVGTFTGASALAWALAVPKDGQVITLDTDHTIYKQYGVPIISKCRDTFGRIIPMEGPLLTTLDALLEEKMVFDFVFIDADEKEEYPEYYERCVQLLRPGGVILVANALREGKEADLNDATSKAVDEVNRKIFEDKRTNSFLVNCGDGLHVAFKL